jgi:hypothetical protein
MFVKAYDDLGGDSDGALCFRMCFGQSNGFGRFRPFEKFL